jgi:hypothetical protein
LDFNNAKVIVKRRPSFGKENSPTKKAPKSPTKELTRSPKKMLTRSPTKLALIVSRLGELDFRNPPVQSSSPKSLKQAKLQFDKKKTSSKKKVQETPVIDTDATYCEVLEKEKKKKRSDVWLSKTVLEKSGEALHIRRKRSPTVKRKNNNNLDGLFNFQMPVMLTPKPMTQTEDMRKKTEDLLIETPIKIKEEKLSESDLDIFGSDDDSSRGSSVVIIDVPADQTIVIPEHTIHSDDSLLASLERGFLDQPQYEESSPMIPATPPRKRKRTYGECSECREFYDNYAAKFGATEAEEHIRHCPITCKAFTYKQRLALPKPVRPPLPEPRLDPYTPEGFWDIAFTADDPDRTQDGL